MFELKITLICHGVRLPLLFKLSYKINFEIWKVKSRVATNSYRMVNLKTQKELIIAGDILVKLNNITEDEALNMCDEMERIANREAVETRARIDIDASRATRSANPQRRSARERREVNEAVDNPDLANFFEEDPRPGRTTRSGRSY